MKYTIHDNDMWIGKDKLDLTMTELKLVSYMFKKGETPSLRNELEKNCLLHGSDKKSVTVHIKRIRDKSGNPRVIINDHGIGYHLNPKMFDFENYERTYHQVRYYDGETWRPCHLSFIDQNDLEQLKKDVLTTGQKGLRIYEIKEKVVFKS